MNQLGTINVAVLQQPKKAGCYVIAGDFRVYVARKPRWAARKLARWLLEWQWEDQR